MTAHSASPVRFSGVLAVVEAGRARVAVLKVASAMMFSMLGEKPVAVLGNQPVVEMVADQTPFGPALVAVPSKVSPSVWPSGSR